MEKKALIVGYGNTKIRFNSKICFKPIEVYELIASNKIMSIHDIWGQPINILNIEEFFNPSLTIAPRQK